MQKIELSKKQKDFLTSELKEVNLLSGVTGSGKSYIANLRFYLELNRIKQSAILLTGNTSESLYKNVIRELLQIDAGFDFISYTTHPQRITTKTGNEIFCVGVNNEGSDKRIQGGNVRLWYADEVTKYPQSSFDMCLSRCREKNEEGQVIPMPAILTCNPDMFTHYIKQRFIDNKNENLADSFLSNPRRSDAEIVVPLLESPGAIAQP
jgi:PBSX family phage terminase large subunit